MCLPHPPSCRPKGLLSNFRMRASARPAIWLRTSNSCSITPAADAGIVSGTAVAKVDPNAQDLGTILAIVLTAKATVVLAGGIALWMRRKNQGRIRIRYPDGKQTDISGAESHDMPKIVQALNAHK